jgi:hypothetical protein
LRFSFKRIRQAIPSWDDKESSPAEEATDKDKGQDDDPEIIVVDNADKETED